MDIRSTKSIKWKPLVRRLWQHRFYSRKSSGHDDPMNVELVVVSSLLWFEERSKCLLTGLELTTICKSVHLPRSLRLSKPFSASLIVPLLEYFTGSLITAVDANKYNRLAHRRLFMWLRVCAPRRLFTYCAKANRCHALVCYLEKRHSECRSNNLMTLTELIAYRIVQHR